MGDENASGNSPSSTGSLGTIAMANDPLAAIVNEQLQDQPIPHPNLEALAREAVSPTDAEQFDPAMHEVDPTTGGPVFNKDGSLRRKRGRVAGKLYDASGNPMEPGAVGEGGCSPLQAKREARLCALSVFKALQGFGPQWEPTSEEEKAVIDPLAEWLQEIGGIGLPTWAEVAVAFGAYVICRINLARFLPPGIAGMVAGPGPAPSIEAMKQMEAVARAQQSGAPLQSTPGKATTATAAPAHNPTSGAQQPPSPLFVPPSNGNVVRRVAPRESIAGGDGFSFANSIGNR